VVDRQSLSFVNDYIVLASDLFTKIDNLQKYGDFGLGLT